MGLIGEDNRVRKSQNTVPLRAKNSCYGLLKGQGLDVRIESIDINKYGMVIGLG